MKKYNLKSLLATTALAVILAGCGQSAYKEGDDEDSYDDGGNYSGDTGGFTGNTPGSPTVTNVTTTNSNTPPSYSWHYEVTGTGPAKVIGGGTMKFSADNMLKVRIKAGNSMRIIGATGYKTAAYNCQWFDVKVGSIVQQAYVKKATYQDVYATHMQDPCASLPAVWEGDFSAGLGSSPTDKTVVISNAQYDNCAFMGDPNHGGCPQHGVYSTHVIDGYVEIVTGNQ